MTGYASVADFPLSDLQRDVLTVLALADGEMSRTEWQDRVRRAEILDASGRYFQNEPFKRLTDDLCRAGAVGLLGNQYAVDPAWMPVAIDATARAGRLELISARLAATMRWRPSSAYGQTSLSLVADLRRALAQNDAAAIGRVLERIPTGRSSYSFDTWSWIRAIGMAPPAHWIDRLPGPFREAYLGVALHAAFTHAAQVGDAVVEAARVSPSPEVRARVASVLALRGCFDEAAGIVANGDGHPRWERAATAFVALARGDWGEARRLFVVASTGAKGQVVEPPSYFAVFALLVAITDETVAASEARRRTEKAKRSLGEWPGAREALETLALHRATGRADVWSTRGLAASWIETLVGVLVESWVDLDHGDQGLAALSTRAKGGGYVWLAARLQDLLERSDDGPSLLALRTRRARWELALDALEGAAKPVSKATGKATAVLAESTLFWQVQLRAWGETMEVVPHLVSGRARVGKRIPIERLAKEAHEILDDRDRRILDALLASSERWDRSVPQRHLALLVGHPRVRDEKGGPITVVCREPELRIEATEGGVRATLVPATFDDSGQSVSREGDELVLVSRTPVAARLLEVLGEQGLVIPKAGIGRLHQVIAGLSGSMAVRASDALAQETKEADARTHVQLFRAGAGLRARLRVAPGGSKAASFHPGKPPHEIVVAHETGLARVRRDLALEREHEATLLVRCPILANLPFEGDDRVARELEDCLELLLELREADALVEWPEGQALRVPVTRRADQVRVRVGGGASWLEIEGGVTVDEGRVVEMRELLASASRARGRFVPIGDDEFLALTEDLRGKLEALGRAQELASKGRLSTALLPAIEGWVGGLDVTWSEEVQRRRDAIAQSEQVVPRVPRSLAAELRDYQKDGFVFLARRTGAGLGACLADDMGLGKTVQTIALLLHRASQGPALVVAPMSVCRGWEDELARFAPTLRCARLAEGDREEVIRGAGARDVLLASYGLLVASEEILASRRWTTVVFDEAHALKNATTRRWKAARALQADAVVALTGTPVENHVGELHAVLDVVVPGMLGPRAAFARGFGDAMSEGSRNAVTALRQIVRPLVLRRTKAQVLEELPSKTEMTRIVDPTPEHRAFYEATRRRALEQMAASASSGGQARIQILAEITRLRRAAIDPRLVGGEAAPAGAKLDALIELVAEIREEGHRALVFSQFLEVLDIAKERLEAAGVACRRLDGTMNASARAAEVNAFQSGAGDVFLLSLKAGGVGMNLTGADFVIHLDPWWNPAVEDQATDRAHRIGQTRPVTVVRLVTGGTIEEKVLALHGAKRKLYEDVIGAADGAGTLDVAALAELLGGG